MWRCWWQATSTVDGRHTLWRSRSVYGMCDFPCRAAFGSGSRLQAGPLTLSGPFWAPCPPGPPGPGECFSIQKGTVSVPRERPVMPKKISKSLIKKSKSKTKNPAFSPTPPRSTPHPGVITRILLPSFIIMFYFNIIFIIIS